MAFPASPLIIFEADISGNTDSERIHITNLLNVRPLCNSVEDFICILFRRTAAIALEELDELTSKLFVLCPGICNIRTKAQQQLAEFLAAYIALLRW